MIIWFLNARKGAQAGFLTTNPTAPPFLIASTDLKTMIVWVYNTVTTMSQKRYKWAS